MSIVVSSASALGTPISWHIEIAGPDVCATLSGGVHVNDVVFRIPRSVERLAEDRRLPHGFIRLGLRQGQDCGAGLLTGQNFLTSDLRSIP
jgi:hypothetical protein